MNGVVPVSMKVVRRQSQRLHIGVRDLDAERIRTRIELGLDGQAGGGADIPNELHHRLVIDQWPPAPVFGDVAEEPVLDPVPFGRSPAERATR